MILSKKTTLLSFAFLLLLTSSLFSQTKIKTNIVTESNFEAQEVIDATLKIENYHYVISHIYKKYICKKFTNEMKFVSKTEFIFENKRVLNIKPLENKIIFVYTEDRIKKKQMGNIYAHFFDPTNMELSIQNTILEKFICENEFLGARIYSINSQNGYLLLNKLGYRTRKKIFPSKVKLFNNKLEELWNKELKHTNKNILITMVCNNIIDKSGGVYMILSYIDNEKNKIIETNLEKISLTNNKIFKKLSLKKIEAADIKFGKNNNIIIAGKYSSGKGNQFGTCVITLDKASFEKKSYSEVLHSAELLSKGQSKSVRNQFKRLYNEDGTAHKASIVFLASYSGVGNIIFKEDGGFFIVNKNIRQYTNTSYHERFGASTGEVFDTKGVIITSVDNNGKISWDQFIPKNQTLSTKPGFDVQLNMDYSDCSYSSYNNKLFFVFNDMSKNITTDKGIKVFEGKKKNSSLFLVKIDENGKMNKTIIFDNSELEGMTLVNKRITINDNKTQFFLSDDEKQKKRKINRILTIEF
jgi:hypothetical protein